MYNVPWLRKRFSEWNCSHRLRDSVCRDLLRCDIRTLLHQGSDSEPQRVKQSELILQYWRLIDTVPWAVPLVRTEPAQANTPRHLASDQDSIVIRWGFLLRQSHDSRLANSRAECKLIILKMNEGRFKVLWLCRSPSKPRRAFSWLPRIIKHDFTTAKRRFNLAFGGEHEPKGFEMQSA